MATLRGGEGGVVALRDRGRCGHIYCEAYGMYTSTHT